jgi:hypothetical protein
MTIAIMANNGYDLTILLPQISALSAVSDHLVEGKGSVRHKEPDHLPKPGGFHCGAI